MRTGSQLLEDGPVGALGDYPKSREKMSESISALGLNHEQVKGH